MRRVRMTMMAATLTVAGWASAGAQAPLAADQTMSRAIENGALEIRIAYGVARRAFGLDDDICGGGDRKLMIESSTRLREMVRSKEFCFAEWRRSATVNFEFYYNAYQDYQDEILAALTPGGDGVPADMPYETRLRRALAVVERLGPIKRMMVEECVSRPVIEMLPAPERAGLTVEEAAALSGSAASLSDRLSYLESRFIREVCFSEISKRVGGALIEMRKTAGGPIPRPRPGSLLARTMEAMTDLRRLTDFGWRMARDAPELCDDLFRRGPTLAVYRYPWVLGNRWSCREYSRALGGFILIIADSWEQSFYQKVIGSLLSGDMPSDDLNYSTRLALLSRFLDDSEPVIARIGDLCLDTPLTQELYFLGTPNAAELARIASSDRPEGLFTQHELMTMNGECINALIPRDAPNLLDIIPFSKP